MTRVVLRHLAGDVGFARLAAAEVDHQLGREIEARHA